MKIVLKRAIAVMITPRQAWQEIKEEKISTSGLIKSYVMVLALIPAVAQFIGHALIGQRMAYFNVYRWSISRALGSSLFSYVTSIIAVILTAWIITVLAPSFSSARDFSAALKLSAFSITPFWLAGILYLFPDLWPLTLLAALYGVFLLFLGFGLALIDTPKALVPAFTAVSAAIAFSLNIVFFFIRVSIFAIRFHSF